MIFYFSALQCFLCLLSYFALWKSVPVVSLGESVDRYLLVDMAIQI